MTLTSIDRHLSKENAGYLKNEFFNKLLNSFFFYLTEFTQDMKDDKKLKKHIKIQLTQPSFKAYACNEVCTIQLYLKKY